MRIAIVGAGAIGGFLAARLTTAGQDVTLVARGATLAAIRANGLGLVEADGETRHVPVRATDDMREAGPHDVVLLALKAHQLAAAVPGLASLTGPGTAVVTLQNGIPWWYFHDHGGPLAGTRLETIDLGGTIASAIDPARVIGGVIYTAGQVVAPGVVKHGAGNRFVLGEPSGIVTPRVEALARALESAGLQAPITRDIRTELWLKLWGNLSLNPISALTHATLIDMCRDDDARALATTMMREAEAIAGRLGITFGMTLEERLAAAERIGAHKSSMLQDVEAGRPPELAALVGVVIELGRLTGVATPAIDAVHACATLLARTLLRAGGRLAIQPV